MGPLFALIILVVIYVILAAVAGLVFWLFIRFLYWVYGVPKERSLEKKARWFFLKLTPYFVFALLAQILISEHVRDVGAPIGDSWAISLPNNHELLAIDTWDNWNLFPTSLLSEAIITGVRKFEYSDDVIYGVLNDYRFFVYSLSELGEPKYIGNDIEFRKVLAEHGVGQISLEEPGEIWRQKRVLGDVITLLIFLVYPAFKLVMFLKLMFVGLTKANPISL